MDIPWRTKKRAAQPVQPVAPVREPCFARRRTSGGVEEAPKLVYAAPSAEPPAPTSEDEPELAAFAAAMEEEERERDDGMQGAEREAAEAMLGMATDKAVADEAGVKGAARGKEALGEGRGAAEEQGTIASLLESALEEQLDAATVEEAEQGEDGPLPSEPLSSDPSSPDEPVGQADQPEESEEQEEELFVCSRCGRAWDGSTQPAFEHVLGMARPTQLPHVSPSQMRSAILVLATATRSECASVRLRRGSAVLAEESACWCNMRSCPRARIGM